MRLLGVCVLWFALGFVPAYGQDGEGLPLDLATAQAQATIRGTNVNFRTGPGTQFPRVGQFGGGNPVRVVGRQGNWVQVAMVSSQGEERVWVHGSYVQEIASVDPSVPSAGQRIDLPALVREHLAVVRDPARFHVGNAARLMNENFQALDSLDPAAMDYAAIDRDPDQLIRDLFALTLALDDRMAAFDAQGQFDVAMVEAKRRAMRGLRFLREQVMMRMTPEQRYAHGEPRLAHQLPGFQWVVNPDHDVPIGRSTFPRTFFLMNVGNSTVSAAIARSSSVDTMFSHFSIGYFLPEAAEVEGKTLPAGTLVTMEAHIEAGVLIMPWADHFKSSAREVIFFVRDRDKQADVDRAAGIMFERVRRALNKGKAIGYDFSMGHKGLKDVLEGGEAGSGGQPAKQGLIHATNYFCSGVADAIGDEAGVNLFTHRSKLEQGSNSAALFRSWGMDPSLRVPAPGDGDVSTSLVRVAEGTQVATLTDSHLMHAVLKSMFEWMDTDGYTLRQPWWFKAGSFVAGNVNSDSFNIGFIPRGIDTSIMRSFAALHKSATAYSERLAAENDAFRARQGRNMTPREAKRFLRTVRDDVKGAKPWFGR